MMKLAMGFAALYVIAWAVADKEAVPHYRRAASKYARPLLIVAALAWLAILLTSDFMPRA